MVRWVRHTPEFGKRLKSKQVCLGKELHGSLAKRQHCPGVDQKDTHAPLSTAHEVRNGQAVLPKGQPP